MRDNDLKANVTGIAVRLDNLRHMNIHYDVTGLLTVVWRSHSGQIVWPAGVGQGRGGF